MNKYVRTQLSATLLQASGATEKLNRCQASAFARHTLTQDGLEITGSAEMNDLEVESATAPGRMAEVAVSLSTN